MDISTSIRLDETLRDELIEEAQKEQRTLANYIRKILANRHKTK